MIEFKQIIGRGTRTYDGKYFFTIWDFVKAHENFNDPEWDGPPEEVTPPKPRQAGGAEPQSGPAPEPTEPCEGGDDGEGGGDGGPVTKIMVKLADGKARSIRYIATTTYWGPDGKPISAIEFLHRLFGDLKGIVGDEDQLRTIWSNPDNREHLLTQLDGHGYDPDRLDDIRRLVNAPKSDLYDVLSYILFSNPPKTRHDRAETLRQVGMGNFSGEMKELLLGILKAYETAGETELAGKKLGQFLTARYGSVSESKAKLGDLQTIRDAYNFMQAGLYAE
jgi:type I restriction enzyme R subunit